jgi:hypothetical protein
MYHGDSEDEDENLMAKISDDSEPEKSEEVSAHQSPIDDTGDILKRPATTSVKNVLVRPRIQAAPTVSLVSYDREDDEGGSDNDEDSSDKEGESYLLGRPTSLRDDLTRISPFNADSPLPTGDSSLEDPTTRPRHSPRINLPPAPSGQCKPELQAKIVQLLQKQRQRNIRLNKSVQSRKDFRNPSIYEKLVGFLGLDELGSNYEHRTFDDRTWSSDCFYDALGKVQKEQFDKKEKEKVKERTRRMQVEFVSGTAIKRPAVLPVPMVNADPSKKRATKWDTGVGVAVKVAGNVNVDGGGNPLDAAKKAAMNIGLMHQPLRRK